MKKYLIDASNFFRNNISFLLILFFITITFVSGGYSVYRYLDLNSRSKTPTEDVLGEDDLQKEDKVETAKTVVDKSVFAPDENPPKAYKVADDMPFTISIPRIKRIGYIQQVGIDQFKNIAVPSNIHMGGWYVNSVKPGEKGLSIIDGHRDGIINKGLFYGIESLKPNDYIDVKYGNGQIVTFKVVRTITVEEADAKKHIYSKDPSIDSQLNLISCIGTFDPEDNTYDKRIIVIAKRAK